jgi:very-short-patch-repair endonuclease
MRRPHDHARVRSILASLGGIAPSRDLVGAGVTLAELRAAVLDHAVLRFRKGWYTLFELPDSVIQASRVGGMVGCVSAARHHGLWVPDDDARLHVAVPAHASRLRAAHDHHVRLSGQASTVVHWVTDWTSPYDQVASVEESIRLIASCRGPAIAFVVLESARHKRRISSEVSWEGLPRATMSLLASAGDLSASGTESLLVLLFRGAGIAFRQQVYVPGVGFVDFVIGDRLIVEADSKAHHSDPTVDRRRDAEASAQGYRTLRFMYSQVVHEGGRVLRAVQAAILRGDHLDT